MNNATTRRGSAMLGLALALGTALAQQGGPTTTPRPSTTQTTSPTAPAPTAPSTSTTATPTSPAAICGLTGQGTCGTSATAAQSGGASGSTGATSGSMGSTAPSTGSGGAGSGSSGTVTSGTGTTRGATSGSTGGTGTTGTTGGTTGGSTGGSAGGTSGSTGSTTTPSTGTGAAGTGTTGGSTAGSTSGGTGNAGSATSGAATSGNTSGARLTSTDTCFAQQATLSDLFEIQSSQLAAGQANSAQVKSLAQQLIRDHTAANRQLSTLASRLGLRLPTALEGPKLTELAALRGQRGVAFDRAFVTAQITSHEQAVNLFSAYSKLGNANAQLKAHATRTLPVLQRHLTAARTLLGTLAK